MSAKHTVKKLIAYILCILVLMTVVSFFFGTGTSHRSIAGLKPPVQTETTGGTHFDKAGYKVDVTYMYEYDMDALVVHTNKHYGLGLEKRLSPIDTAVCWGTVAQYNDRVDFNWSQSGRFSMWHVDSYEELSVVGDETDVNTQIANCHLVPADSSVRRQVKRIHAGDHIRVKGYLVDIYGVKDNGQYFTWTSSTTREDTGDGACELIYVTSVEWL